MFRKRSFLLLLLFISIFVLASGCSSTETNSVDDENDGMVEASISYPLTIKDGTGTDVTLQSEPKRIISLMPSLTETLYAIGAGEQVIAVTAYDNYPETAQQDAEYVFQDALNPSLEQIISLQPDLIVMGPYNDELTKKIIELGIPVIKYDPQSIDEVYEMIEALGKATNKSENASQTIEEMKDREKKLTNMVNEIPDEEKVKVWLEVSNDLWTAGQNTFINELITKAGGVNIVKEQGWIQYSEEKIIDENPEVVIINYGGYDVDAISNIYKREGWQQVDAIKNNRVINIDNDLITRTGPRIIDGLEEIVKALYPKLF